MTFSIAGTDSSGALGIAITSSSPAVAARCAHVRAGVGAVCSQNVTDPRLGPLVLDALGADLSVDDALSSVTSGREFMSYRQVTVLVPGGSSAVFTGSGGLGVVGTARSASAVAAGNLLTSSDIPAAMVAAFDAASGDLELRLMAALRAGLDAGGEAGPVRSAGLSVVRSVPWRETDLRVDWDDAPISALSSLLDVWMPQRDDYVRRALDPSEAPSYGVPGDE